MRGVALYAPDPLTVYVVYKRLRTEDDTSPADLVLAKSINGGWTWESRVLDADTMDTRDPTGHALAIDGSGDTVAIAWQERRGMTPADVRLKVAVSVDEGASFRTSLVVPSHGGEGPSVAVPDALHVVVGYRDLSGPYGGVAVARSADAGATWTTQALHDRVASPRHVDVAAPTALHQFVVSGAQTTQPTLRLDTTGDGGLAWRERLATPGSKGPSVSAPSLLDVYVADGSSEQGGPMHVKVGRSRDGGSAWCLRAFDEADLVYGTVLDAPGAEDAWLGYWKLDPHATLVLARTRDGGATWQTWDVPHTFDVGLDFDVSAPSSSMAYAAYFDGYDLRVVRLAP